MPLQIHCDYVAALSSKTVDDVAKKIRNLGLRAAENLRNEKITRKIPEHSMQKLPYILVVGDKEKEAGAVAVRARGNIDLGVMPLDAFVQKNLWRHHSQVCELNRPVCAPRHVMLGAESCNFAVIDLKE